MPFRGLHNGTLVAPATIPNQTPVTCPDCGDTMYARGGDQKARHFYHPNHQTSACPTIGGESDTHARCVALAVAALETQFGEQADYVRPEVTLKIPHPDGTTGHRRADTLLKFNSENPYFGHGIIIEVQHRHHDKDISATTEDYLHAGYSVAWVTPDDFDVESLAYDRIDDAFAASSAPAYSVRDSSPRAHTNCAALKHTGTHTWKEIPASINTVEHPYEVCIGQHCERRRRDSDSTDRYVYGDAELSPPDLPLKVLRDALVMGHGSPESLPTNLSQRYPVATLEKALAARPEVEPCRAPSAAFTP